MGDYISLSGGDDDAHGNQTELEAALNAGNAIWEITRYSGVVHGFTKWDAADAYSLKADARSWESMMTTFEQLLPLPVRLLDDGDGGDVEAPAPLDSNSDSPSSSPTKVLVLSTDLQFRLYKVALRLRFRPSRPMRLSPNSQPLCPPLWCRPRVAGIVRSTTSTCILLRPFFHFVFCGRSCPKGRSFAFYFALVCMDNNIFVL